MSIRYYEQPRYQKLPLIRALFAANLLFAVATLVAWQSAFIHLIAPLTWAVNDTVTFEHSFPAGIVLPALHDHVDIFWIQFY